MLVVLMIFWYFFVTIFFELSSLDITDTNLFLETVESSSNYDVSTFFYFIITYKHCQIK